MDYKEAINYLSNYTNYEREMRYPYDGWAMNLTRVRALLTEVGDPDKKLRVVHVAGTKGKGSTAAMIEAIGRAAGMKTGLFTSPHLLDFRERIRLSGKWVPEEAVAKWVEKLAPAAEAVHERKELGTVTYFEILTALALAVFADHEVELTVLEAGLGGRYDATTACEPEVSVITHISLDHTDILGETLTEIATEKSMIIKPGKPAVIAPQRDEAMAVLEKRAKETGSELIKVEENYTWQRMYEDIEGQMLSFSGGREVGEVLLPLLGDPQATNAATAIAVCDVLAKKGLSVSDDHIREGLSSVKWPARFERVRKGPDVILDGAHNAESAAHLRQTLSRLYPERKVTAVLGLGGDKDVEGFCRELGPALVKVIITRSTAMKAVASERIREALSDLPIEVTETGSVKEAIEAALVCTEASDVVLVTGSFYVISEAMELGYSGTGHSS